MPRPMRIGALSRSARSPAFPPSTTRTWVGAPRRLLGDLAVLGALPPRGGPGRVGDPGAEHVGADHRDRGQHEDPEDREVGEADEQEGQLRHRRPPR